MDAEFWTALGFLCFVLLAIYYGAHSRISEALDERARRIRNELDEAERLRKEAADVLASFEGKRARAEQEAAAIVEQAQAEAELMGQQASARLDDFVRRRTAQAEAKIANAEVQALAQVRAAAADAATSAATIVLREQKDGSLADKLLDESIAAIRRLAH